MSEAYPRTETAESPIANWQQHDPYRGQDAANSGAPEWQKAPDLVDGAF